MFVLISIIELVRVLTSSFLLLIIITILAIYYSAAGPMDEFTRDLGSLARLMDMAWRYDPMVQ